MKHYGLLQISIFNGISLFFYDIVQIRNFNANCLFFDKIMRYLEYLKTFSVVVLPFCYLYIEMWLSMVEGASLLMRIVYCCIIDI